MSEKEHQWLTDKYWVTQHNYLDEVRSQFDLPEEVRIHEVTLREAEQAPHVVLRPEQGSGQTDGKDAAQDKGFFPVPLAQGRG